MYISSRLLAVSTFVMLCSCAAPPPTAKPSGPTALPVEVSETAVEKNSDSVKVQINPASTPVPAPFGTPVAPAAKPVKPVPVEEVWFMKNGKLEGAVNRPAGRVLNKVKNKKGDGFTSDICYDYGTFAIFESKSSDEVGSVELYIRRKGDGPLCSNNYKGLTQNLKLREGSFAGVAGEFVVTEGSDTSEFLLESQIFALGTGAEVLRVVHDPREEYRLAANGARLSVTFHSKVKVRCDLAIEGKPCWSRIVKENKLPLGTKMPDCAAEFKKAKKSVEEPALITVRTRIRNIRKPKLEYLAGSAACAPEP